jgi:RNA polymerase primary sigma factor
MTKQSSGEHEPIWAYLDESLAGPARLAFEPHFRQCPWCQRQARLFYECLNEAEGSFAAEIADPDYSRAASAFLAQGLWADPQGSPLPALRDATKEILERLQRSVSQLLARVFPAGTLFWAPSPLAYATEWQARDKLFEIIESDRGMAHLVATLAEEKGRTLTLTLDTQYVEQVGPLLTFGITDEARTRLLLHGFCALYPGELDAHFVSELRIDPDKRQQIPAGHDLFVVTNMPVEELDNFDVPFLKWSVSANLHQADKKERARAKNAWVCIIKSVARRIELKERYQNLEQWSWETLVDFTLPLIHAIIQKLHLPMMLDIPKADLIQSGLYGVFKAFEKFDPDKQITFVSYAYKWIFGEIRRTVAESLGTSPLICQKLWRLKTSLCQELGVPCESTSWSELLALLGEVRPAGEAESSPAAAKIVPAESRAEMLQAADLVHLLALLWPSSLETKTAEGIQISAPEVSGEDEDEPVNRIDPVKFQKALGHLREKEREILHLRIEQGQSFKEIARHLGITENNAKVRYHRAAQKIQISLQKTIKN